MSGTKEIRTKIASIKNTQKITGAMQMVATSKMRKAQENRDRGRPYADSIYQLIGHLAHANSEYRHPFMIEKEVRRIGYIVISTDRGLCGGLNTNMFKRAITEMKQWDQRGVEIDLCLIGKKAINFFNTYGGNVVAAVDGLSDRPNLSDLIGVIKVMIDAFREQRINRLDIVFNNFVNAMIQEPWDIQILPLKPSSDLKDNLPNWDYIYEPDAKELLDQLLVRYVESLVYQAVVENIACEQAARIVAMKNATDNAEDIVNELELAYNKARQAAITQEISEIVGGAAAV